MKGWSHRNMGETYHSLPSLSHLTAKAAIKNSGQLLLSAPERFPPSLRHPRCRRTLPPDFLLVTLFYFLFPFLGSWLYHHLVNIQPQPLAQSLQSMFPSPEPFLLTPLYLTTTFPFPPSLLSFISLSQCQAETDLTLINKFHLPRRSRNIVQMQKLIFFPSSDAFSCF